MKEKRDDIPVGTTVKVSFIPPGEPIASRYEIVGADAVHYEVRNLLGGKTHRIPKRCAILVEDYHLTH
jgi:hypothetical protein